MDNPIKRNEPATLAEAKEALKIAEAALEKAMLERKSLDGEVHLKVREFAHDIKSALTGVVGYSQLMRNGVFEADQIEKYAETIHRSGTRVVEICEAMLQYSDPDNTAPPDVMQEVAVGEIIEEVVDLYAEMASDRGVNLKAEVSPEFPPINTVPQHIYRALTNVVTNALKFTPEGGNVAIKADVDPQEDAVVLIVRDSGEGIPPDQIMDILKPGVTTVSGRGDKGTGLGLPIVAKLIRDLGGTVNISSRPGHGTNVTLKFPKELTL